MAGFQTTPRGPRIWLACTVFLASFGTSAARSAEGIEISYNGKTTWDPDSATVTFSTSGSMPDTLEGFYWEIPERVKSVVIESEVTVRGAFRVGYRQASNPLTIRGRDRKTSILFGTDEPKWTVALGWGGETGTAKITIENLTIRGIDPDGRYNMAPFTWESGSTGTRNLTVRGLHIDASGTVYDERSQTWIPLGLLELKPQGATVNLNVTGAELHGMGKGMVRTQGTIRIDGKVW